jgi:ubiquinone/menaquinone biosynthesis C-methylase UbiE
MSEARAPQTRGLTIRWWAPLYDAVAWLSTGGQEGAIRRETIAAAKISAGNKVLDVGCGTGTLVIAAAKKAKADGEVHGIDASPEMIELARRKAAKHHASATFQVAPIEALPFPDDTFDVVLSTFMLHHLPDDVKMAGFAQIGRVLKPGGHLLAVDFADGNRSIIGRIGALFGHIQWEGYTESLKVMMSAAQFENVREQQTRRKYLAFLHGMRPAKS